MFFHQRIFIIMSRLLASFAAAFGIFSCAAAVNNTYNVNVNFTPDEDGLLLYMVNYDDGSKIDSAVVSNGVATLSGTVENPVLAQLVLDGNRAGSFVLEPGKTTVDTEKRKVTAEGPLNKDWDNFNARLAAIAEKYQTVYQSDDSNKQEKLDVIESEYRTVSDSMFTANAGNINGYRLFLDRAYELTPAEFEAEIVKYPDMANFARVKKLRTSKANEAATSVGNKFKDFTIQGPNGPQRLSDYVGKGNWTLVDFWASWCGPCIRETKTIKELYSKYNGKGLDFLGVAVWDKPEETRKAIQEHQLPWPMIIDAQTIPTDIYGIAGIPCIILFDPEGNIVSRNKQGADLVKDVEAAMATLEAE